MTALATARAGSTVRSRADADGVVDGIGGVGGPVAHLVPSHARCRHRRSRVCDLTPRSGRVTGGAYMPGPASPRDVTGRHWHDLRRPACDTSPTRRRRQRRGSRHLERTRTPRRRSPWYTTIPCCTSAGSTPAARACESTHATGGASANALSTCAGLGHQRLPAPRSARRARFRRARCKVSPSATSPKSNGIDASSPDPTSPAIVAATSRPVWSAPSASPAVAALRLSSLASSLAIDCDHRAEADDDEDGRCDPEHVPGPPAAVACGRRVRTPRERAPRACASGRGGHLRQRRPRRVAARPGVH